MNIFRLIIALFCYKVKPFSLHLKPSGFLNTFSAPFPPNDRTHVPNPAIRQKLRYIRARAPARIRHVETLLCDTGVQLRKEPAMGTIKLSSAARRAQLFICFSASDIAKQPVVNLRPGNLYGFFDCLDSVCIALHGNSNRRITRRIRPAPRLVSAWLPVYFSPAQLPFSANHGVILSGDVLKFQIPVLADPRIFVPLYPFFCRNYRLLCILFPCLYLTGVLRMRAYM